MPLLTPGPSARRRLLLLCPLGLLAACAAPVLMMSPQGQLMWALLKPMVGLDPNTFNLWGQPMIQQRMTALLGDHYGTVLTLLKTANALQQEGPLFFVVSRATPIPELAEGAGLVWNAETNQMAAMIARGEVVETFAEHLRETVVASGAAAAEAAVGDLIEPRWPGAMQPWLDAARQVEDMRQSAAGP